MEKKHSVLTVSLLVFCCVLSCSKINASEDPSKESSGMPKLHIQPIHDPVTTEVVGAFGGVSTQFSGGGTAGIGAHYPSGTVTAWAGLDKPSWDASAGYSGGRWTLGIGKKF